MISNLKNRLKNRRSRRAPRYAFTLVEVLVAMAVLSILVLILGQVMLVTGQAISLNSKRLDATGQVREFFDRLGADLEAKPQRSDLTNMFTSQPGNDNDTLQFYSAVGGYNSTADSVPRQLSLIKYMVAKNPSIPSDGALGLVRQADQADWNGSQMAPVFGNGKPPPAVAASPDTDTDLLAPGIIRMEFCYVSASGTSAGNAYTLKQPAGSYSLVVAVAAMDEQNRALLQKLESTQPGATAKLIGLFFRRGRRRGPACHLEQIHFRLEHGDFRRDRYPRPNPSKYPLL